MQFLANFALQLERFCKAVLFVLFIVMVVTTFAQVIFRFIFFNSLSWSEELSRYCLIWLTFIGGALGVRKKIHVAVEALTMFFPSKIKRAVTRINYILLAVFAAVLIKYGFTLSTFNMKQLSPAMHIPIGLSYAAIPVGGLFILIFVMELLMKTDGEGGAAQ